MIKTTVVGFDAAKRAIVEAIRAFETSAAVTVGVHESGAARGDEPTNAQIGAAHEFGGGGIPARPWLVPGVASGNQDYVDVMLSALQNGKTLDQALDMIGVIAVAKVQVYMTELRTPPNSPRTIKLKGSSNPLIDTGVLRSSVTYEVTDIRPREGI